MEISQVATLNPVTLAYVGDAVFTLYVRTRVVERAERRAEDATLACVALVRATAQADMLTRIEPLLSPDEADAVRRGRNCHTPNKAKHASLSAYKRATALECLFGWLYLRGEHERLRTLCDACLADECPL